MPVGYGQSRPPKRIFTDASLQEDADMSLELMKVPAYTGRDEHSKSKCLQHSKHNINRALSVL